MSGRKSTKKLLWFEVLNDFEKKHENRYDYKYLEEDYKNSTTKVRIICKEHGVFKQLPSEHKNGSGCPFCSKTKKLTQDEVILRFRTKHNDRYDYSFVEYTTWSNNVKIICSEHGIFEQSPSNHTKGAGCPTCAKILKSKKLRKPIKDILEDFNEVHFDKYEYLNLDTDYKNSYSKIKIVCKEHGTFEQQGYAHYIAGHGCPQCKTNSKEEFLTNLFKEYNINYIYNDRNLIKPLEIDILVPDFKFGIEHNGLYFHSYGISNWSATNNYDKLNKNKHLNKTIEMEKINFQLFHIREDHLVNPIKKDIWKSILLNKCGISHKKDARKLQVVNLSGHNSFTKEFLENNHLQGNCPSSIKLGLQDPKTGIVYSIMTFGKSRFNKNIEYELLRFCNLKYHNVRGAASKLLKAFERTHKPYSLVSYANRDWSMGNLYSKLGFEYNHISEPNYIYTNERKEIISRQQTQKHKLKNFLESRNQIFIENLSERDNMIGNGYRIYYDTGNLVYYKNYKRQFNDTNN